MLRVLKAQQEGLHTRISHINAQSLNSKIDEFRYLFIGSGIDIICISETWFIADVLDCANGVNGYNLFRLDRASRTGGGVAIYVHTELRCKFLSKAEANISFEYIMLKFSNDSKKIMLGAIYRPHKLNNLDPFYLNKSFVQYQMY